MTSPASSTSSSPATSSRRRDVVRTAPFIRARGVLEERAGEQRTLVADAVEQFLPATLLPMPSGKEFG